VAGEIAHGILVTDKCSSPVGLGILTDSDPDGPRLEFDNNRSERPIKPFVIGRKNCLFANAPRGAKERDDLQRD